MSDNNRYDTMPFPFDSPSPLPIESEGLKIGLRDWFAAQALAGLLADPEINYTYDVFATASYRLADAMLAERVKERE